MKNINVLHVIKNTGTESQQISALQKYTDINLHVLIPTGVKLNSIPCTTYSNANEIKKLIKNISPDIIHTHDSHELRTIASKAGKFKLVHSQHNVEELNFFAKLTVGNLSDIVIATTDKARESLIKTGTSATKIRMVFNGTEPLAEDEKTQIELRNKLNITKTDFVVACLGNSHTDTILNTAKELPYNVIVIILGSDSRTMPENLNNVRIADVNNTEDILSIADVITCPPQYEMYKPLFLGMSIGKPIIALNMNRYIMEDKINGLTIPSFEADKLDDAITRLKEDPPLYSTLSNGARKRFAERFTIQKMANNIADLYKRLIE